MDPSGITRVSPATSTTIPSRTASVSGNEIEDFVPLPALDLIVTRPPSDWIAVLTTSIPDAAARQRRNFGGGREAGHEKQAVNFGIAQLGVLGDQAVFDGFLANFFAIDPAAVVRHFDDHAPGPVRGAQRDGAFGFLPAIARFSLDSSP